MLEPKQLPAKINDTPPEISQYPARETERKLCTGHKCGNVGDKKINLTQCYTHFKDGPCHAFSQSVNSETESVMSLKDSSEKNLKEKNSCSDGQMRPTIWKCSYNCGKIFTQEKYMKNHVVVMHENTSLVQCKMCFKFLSTKGRLKSHMLRHSGVQHLVCLICVKERSNDLSCIRHHLLEKHGIDRKHYLFHDSYYEMSLKEISFMKMPESKEIFSKGYKEMESPMNKYKRSASNLNELRWKLMEKSKRVKDLLKEITDNVGSKQKNGELTKKLSFIDNSKGNIGETKIQKIVTAENGMKLIKLPNGQFIKDTSNSKVLHFFM